MTMHPSSRHSTPARELTGYAPLRLDVRKYESYLAEFDLSDAQRADVLEILWTMMSSLVDLAFADPTDISEELRKTVSMSQEKVDARIP